MLEKEDKFSASFEENTVVNFSSFRLILSTCVSTRFIFCTQLVILLVDIPTDVHGFNFFY